MSTDYHRFREPISSVQIGSPGGGHTRLALFVNGACAGDITLRNEEVVPFLWALAEDTATARASFVGGRKVWACPVCGGEAEGGCDECRDGWRPQVGYYLSDQGEVVRLEGDPP